MKPNFICTVMLFLVIILVSSCSPSTDTSNQSSNDGIPLSGQAAWDKYAPSTIQSIIAEFKGEVEKVNQGYTIYPYATFQVKMIYQGLCRDISPGRIELLSMWTFAVVPKELDRYVGLNKHECLFKEGAAGYWLPIQEPLLPHLEIEVGNGHEVILFIRWLGANRDTKEIDWVFWIAAFNLMKG
jgi:hypothetical protein